MTIDELAEKQFEFRGLRRQPPAPFLRAKKALAQAFAALNDPNVGGPIPAAGRGELFRDYNTLQEEADRVWGARHTLSGHWNLQYRCKRLEERANNFHKAVEFSATVAYMRIKAQDAARKRRSSSRPRTSSNATPSRSGGSSEAQLHQDVLLPHELYWCARYTWLEAQGYRLRPRYSPGWIPSWGPRSNGAGREDALFHQHLNIMDAARIIDGKFVMLKKFYKSERPVEAQIGVMFSQLKASERNHGVPVHEVLQDPQDRDVAILVMPLLRPYDNPPFETVGEVVEMLKQVFEGLYFMHRNHVAHRNCRLENVLMDPTHLFPSGYHPVDIDRSVDLTGPAQFISRREITPRYWLTDFRSAHRWDPKKHSTDDHREDAFAIDVRDLGMSIKRTFLNLPSMYFLDPVVTEMIQGRLSARRLVKRFDEHWKAMGATDLRARVRPLDLRGTTTGKRRSLAVFVKDLVFGSGKPPSTPPKGDGKRLSRDQARKAAHDALEGSRWGGREVIPPSSPGQRMPGLLIHRSVDYSAVSQAGSSRGTVDARQQPRRRHVSADGAGAYGSPDPAFLKGSPRSSPRSTPKRRYNSLDEASPPSLQSHLHSYDRPHPTPQSYTNAHLYSRHQPAPSHAHSHSSHNSHHSHTPPSLKERQRDEFDEAEARLNARRRARYDSMEPPEREIPVSGVWNSPLRVVRDLSREGRDGGEKQLPSPSWYSHMDGKEYPIQHRRQRPGQARPRRASAEATVGGAGGQGWYRDRRR